MNDDDKGKCMKHEKKGRNVVGCERKELKQQPKK